MGRITADKLPAESGKVIRLAFCAMFPEGATVEELQRSQHRCFRDIGKYYEKKEAEEHGNKLL